MPYEEAMAAGRKCLAERDWHGAYRKFGKAHGLGHDIRSYHVAAHRGMLRAGWLGRNNPGRVGKQLFLLTAAFLFGGGSRVPAATRAA